MHSLWEKLILWFSSNLASKAVRWILLDPKKHFSRSWIWIHFLHKIISVGPEKKVIFTCHYQSVTSRLETSWYREFSHSFESIDNSLENFGLKKSLSNDLKKFVLEKVVVLVSKTLDLVMVSKSLVSQLLQICPTCPTMNNMSEMSTMLQKSRKCLFNFTF